MKKLLFSFSIVIMLLIAVSVPSLAVSTTDALTSTKIHEIIESNYTTLFNSPYDKNSNSNEYIDPITGSLSITEDILYLPGKNGLDVNLNCTYNNQSIKDVFIKDSTSYDNKYHRTVYYYSYVKESGATTNILVLFKSEDDFLDTPYFMAKELPKKYEDDDGDEFYLFSTFSLVEEGGITFTRNLERSPMEFYFSRSDKNSVAALDPERPHFSELWTWNIPVIHESIHPTYTETIDGTKLYDFYATFIGLDGEPHTLQAYYDIEDGDIKGVFMDVKSNIDYTCRYDGPTHDIVDTEKNLTYRCSIQDPQGRTMYFSYHGYLVAVEDRFGNIIRYTFSGEKPVQIIDTLGRIITFEYTEDTVAIYLDSDGEGRSTPELYTTFTVTKTNDSEIDPNDYIVSDDTYTCTLTRYEDVDTARSTIYTYKKRHPIYFSSTNLRYCEEVVSELVTQISYPNNLKTNYFYARKSTFIDLTKLDYHIISRVDTDHGKSYNEITYDYTSRPNNLGSSATTVQTRTADNLTNTFEGVTHTTSKVTSFDNVKLTEEYTYSTGYGKRKLSSTTQTYKTGSTTGVERKIKTPHYKLRPTGTSYDDYEKEITYHDGSSFVATEIYNQSEDVYIKKTYTLSPEGDDYYTGRTIDSMTVSESVDEGDTYTDKYTVEYTYNPDGTLLSETVDPDGINQVTTYTYTYGTDGSITTTATLSNIKDADGNSVADITTSTKVDYLGRLVASTDGNGNETTYEYDRLNRLVKVTNPDNTTVTYEYDTVNCTTIVTDENGIMTKTQYDAFGNPLSVYKNVSTTTTPRWIVVSEYEYDSLCRPVIVAEYTLYNTRNIPTNWIETHYTYGAFDNVAEVAVYDETGTELSKQTYTYNYADRMGSSSASIEPHDRTNGGTSRKFTSVTVESAPKDGITPPTVKQFLDRQGRLCKQIRTDGDDEYITTYTYDAVGNVLEMKDETAYLDYDVDYSQKYEYNYLNKPVKVYNAEGNFTSNTYDVLGRQLTSTDYMGNSVTYTYDSIGRVLTQSAPVDDNVEGLTRYYYDANSNTICTRVSAASGDISYTASYDSLNRPVSTFNGSTYTVNAYDGTRLVKTASGLGEPCDISGLTASDTTYNVTEYVYDHLGNITTEKHFNGNTTYTYDLSGNVLSSTDPNTNTTYNEYDSRGNLINSSVDGDTISYTYNSFNLVTEASRNGASTTYTYDNFGRNITEAVGGDIISRTYNIAGQVTGMTLTRNDTALQNASYEYNILGNMTSASDGTDTITYTYNENGLPITEEKPGLVTTYEYTPGNLMKSTTNTRRRVNDPTFEEGYNDLRFVSSFEYSYYPDGNVNTVTDTRFDKTYNTIYDYDRANRLILAHTTQDGNRVRTWSYGYNNRGDRVSQTFTDADGVITATTYVYTNHRLTREATGSNVTEYRYDANGNTIAKLNDNVTYQYTYTPRNEVASVTTQSGTYSYTYNASSLRTGKTANGVTTSFIWAGNNIIREDSADKSTDYFYGVNRVSRTVKGDAYTYNAVTDEYYDETTDEYIETITPVNGYHEFYAYDGRGNVVHTMALDSIDLYLSPFYGQTAPFPEMDLNCDGRFDFTDLNTASTKYPIVQDYYYSPFGEIWQGERETDTNPFRYAGEYLDNETGDIYLRARYYDPSIGRFLSIDPIKDGMNWYVYCGNNPVKFVDPSGLAIKLSDNATEEQIKQYNEAIAYLKTSEDGKALVEKLENCDEVIVIEFTENYSESDSYWSSELTADSTSPSLFVPTNGDYNADVIIFWNANGGLVLSDGTSVQSPTVQLAHEMGHTSQYVDGYMDESLQDNIITDYERFKIERNNNTKYETPIAKQLGEPTRANYSDGKSIVEMNNVKHFRTTHNSPQGLMYTIDHNLHFNSAGEMTKIKNIF